MLQTKITEFRLTHMKTFSTFSPTRSNSGSSSVLRSENLSAFKQTNLRSDRSKQNQHFHSFVLPLHCCDQCFSISNLFGQSQCESPEARQAASSHLVQDTGQHLGQPSVQFLLKLRDARDHNQIFSFF